MGKIILENSTYTFQEIKAGNWVETDPYLVRTLAFCQQWLQGKRSFKLQTSGSTGVPKTIQIQRKQMEISAAATGSFFKIQSGALLLCCLNTEMIAGKMMLVRAMAWDADLILVKPTENPLESEWLDYAFDFVAMVPLQVMAALANEVTERKIKKVKQLIIGGAPTQPSLLAQLISKKIPAYQTYGMTETVSHIALAKMDRQELVYRTLPGVKIGTDASGRLYLEAPMAKEERLQTNDLVELLGPETFRWLGRSDFTINSGGIKIQPEQIEAKLAPFLEDLYGAVPFFLFAKADEKLGQKLVLVIEMKEHVLDQQELLAMLKNNLPKYHVPKEIITVVEFVKTASGKINRPETIKSIL